MKQRIALVSQFVLGIFGIYGVGRFVIGHWLRGILELLVVTPVIILVWPMVYIWMYGHEPGWIQGATQIIVDVALTWALWRDLKRQRLAKAMAAAKEAREEVRRERIPAEVRFLVWERDGGRCARCGSTEDLEFDHIIPVSKGGSSTEKNVQLLCAKCNREKRDRIA